MRNLITIILSVAALTGCKQPEAKPVIKISKDIYVLQEAAPSKRCVASWYGEKYRGRLTANGEVFSPDEYTAAHKTLPFGTRLLVKLGPNKVIVRVNDRGPFIKGRELDLSRAAFEELAEKEAGLINVSYSILN